MRCLYVGVFSPHCSDKFRLKGMHQAGWEVRAIDFRQIFAQRGDNGLIADIVHCCITFSPNFILINKVEKFTTEIL